MATTSSEGATRAVVAAMCANGGFEVQLRLPGLAVSGSDSEQLGLATPQFQDVPLFPAIWRRVGVDDGLLVSAPSVNALMSTGDFTSALDLFQGAVGLVVGGVLYGITGCDALMAAGEPCAYRLTLQPPSWV